MKKITVYIGVLALFSLVVSIGIWRTHVVRGPHQPLSVLGESESIASASPSFGDARPTPIPAMSLDRIFSTDHSWIRQLPQENVVTILATGDVIPARSVNYKMTSRNNYRWPFEKTRTLLSSADITVINLETPLLAQCTPTTEGMVFCGSANAADGLADAGIDVATLANNHIGNYGKAGIEETKQILLRSNITPVSETPGIKTVNGIRFAFLAYNDIGAPEAGVPWAEYERIKNDIQQASRNADVILVSFHWGIEYQTQPTKRQQDLARFAIDNGADVILGNHPHWIEPVELYKGKFIIYAHGNFVFDQEWSQETKIGVVGKYTFYKQELVDVEYVPIRIVDYGQPYVLEGNDAKTVLQTLENASRNVSPL